MKYAQNATRSSLANRSLLIPADVLICLRNVTAWGANNVFLLDIWLAARAFAPPYFYAGRRELYDGIQNDPIEGRSRVY